MLARPPWTLSPLIRGIDNQSAATSPSARCNWIIMSTIRPLKCFWVTISCHKSSAFARTLRALVWNWILRGRRLSTDGESLRRFSRSTKKRDAGRVRVITFAADNRSVHFAISRSFFGDGRERCDKRPTMLPDRCSAAASKAEQGKARSESISFNLKFCDRRKMPKIEPK